MCSSMQRGESTPLDEAASHADPWGMTTDQASEFVGMAMASYCRDVGAKYGIGQP